MTAQEPRQLWSDAEIEDLAWNTLNRNGVLSRRSTIAMIKHVRDDLQQRITELGLERDTAAHNARYYANLTCELEQERDSLRQELDQIYADLDAQQVPLVKQPRLIDEQRAMWKEFYAELDKRRSTQPQESSSDEHTH